MRLKKHIILIAAFILLCTHIFAQTPVYLTKTYEPVESDLYDAYPSLEIQGGDTWNNCFVLGVINNYHGRAVFHIGGKYETISFVLGAAKAHGGDDPNIVQIHADGRRIFDYVIRDGDLGKHVTLNISGVDKLEFSLVDPALEAAFVPVGVAAGGAVVGSTLMGVAGLMMLAAGGEAVENSCAAFNTYGEYNSVTFTVECLRKEGDTQLLGLPALTFVTEPAWTGLTLAEGWVRPDKTGVDVIDDYKADFSGLYDDVQEALKKRAPEYSIYTYYLETEAGQICKAVKLFTKGESVASGEDGWRIPYTIKEYKYDLDALESMKENVTDLLIRLPAANVGLVELGLGAISYGKVMKSANKILLEMKKVVDDMYGCARQNEAFLVTLLNSAIDIDGRTSTERTIFAPLLPGETPPSGETAKVRNFSE